MMKKSNNLPRNSDRRTGTVNGCANNSPDEQTPSGFFQKVYELTAKIPCGFVASYGQIAAMTGAPRNARTVGYAMNGVPAGTTLPCHRVVYKDGSLAPEYAFGGSAVQRELLEREGVTFLADGRIDMERHTWNGK